MEPRIPALCSARVSPASFALFDTAIGRCAVAWTERGVARVQLPEADDAATRAKLLARCPGAAEATPRGEAKRAIDAMRAHLGGRMDAMEGVAPRLRRTSRSSTAASTRRCGAWGPGETVGYGELAARVGSPGAARAVGQAVGKNPFAIVVPCHRVLAAGRARAGASRRTEGWGPSAGCWPSRG